MKKIAVLLSICHPNLDWLREQLASVENQTWRQLEVWIADDGPDAPVGERFFAEQLQRTPFHYAVNAENMGASKSFAQLVDWAEGDYLAFCDQDDRWLPEKLEALVKALEDTGAQASYCSLSAIDSSGQKICEDIRAIQRGVEFLAGEGLAKRLYIKNCIYGCSLLLCAQTAKAALPLPEEMGYDHWFTFWAAIQGRITFLDRPLVEHRLHSENVSEPFRGIACREVYYRRRVQGLRVRTESCLMRIAGEKSIAPDVREATIDYLRRVLEWSRARERWSRMEWGAVGYMWRMRKLSPKATYFELLLPFLPEQLLRPLLRRLGRTV